MLATLVNPIQDIPKLYVAVSEWLAVLTMLLVCRKRVAVRRAVPVMPVLFVVLFGLQILLIPYTNVIWVCIMLLDVGCMAGALKFCLKLSMADALYLVARVFIQAEFAASAEWQAYTYYFITPDTGARPYDIPFWLGFNCVFFLIVFLLETAMVRKIELSRALCASGRQAGLMCGIAAVIFAMSNVSYLAVSTFISGSSGYEVFNIRTLMDFSGLFILWAAYLMKLENDVGKEKEAIQNALVNQYQQYQQSQSNIDLINRKYHDMKQQIELLRAGIGAGENTSLLDRLEEDISGYEAQYRTGNAVLDTILTFKGEACRNKDIQLKVVAEGALLEGMDAMDMASIFGNALDNAIEYEEQVANHNQRLIHVTVSRKRQFVNVVVENYYEGLEPAGLKKGELPETTKQDRRYHGFGLKSIRASVLQYGGFMNVAVREGWFRIEILFPNGFSHVTKGAAV